MDVPTLSRRLEKSGLLATSWGTQRKFPRAVSALGSSALRGYLRCSKGRAEAVK